eukprot:CAMPEP_0184415734 /NCGR_PEP_ID=MMETSP0738-20130409/8952_1 /TAXON_ID=385413 /ORGANISM="Thalassiosira miniscula, Strain CCMP1093" /LENGTH=62 /DNA_ID=CAMNT_0026775003 /DNA_START=354 /DNA_END=542 /DNA_ORIENTATION=-
MDHIFPTSCLGYKGVGIAIFPPIAAPKVIIASAAGQCVRAVAPYKFVCSYASCQRIVAKAAI